MGTLIHSGASGGNRGGNYRCNHASDGTAAPMQRRELLPGHLSQLVEPVLGCLYHRSAAPHAVTG
jgi:hypothetical protein